MTSQDPSVSVATNRMPDVDPAPPAGSRAGKGALAIAATLFFWGLGHLLAGRTRRGLMWLVGSVVLSAAIAVSLIVPTLVPALIVLFPLSLVLQVWVLVDAFRCARRSCGAMLGGPLARYAVAGALLAAALFFNPSVWFASYLRSQWVEAFVQHAGSMAPAIAPGDRVFVHKQPWPIRRWDVVVFESIEDPGSRWVSRIAGLPGERVEIVGTSLYINGTVVSPPAGAGPYEGRLQFVRGGNGIEGRPIALGRDEFFVLGDNSPRAADSRYWTRAAAGHPPGALPRDRIMGRVTTIYWPVTRWRQFR